MSDLYRKKSAAYSEYNRNNSKETTDALGSDLLIEDKRYRRNTSQMHIGKGGISNPGSPRSRDRRLEKELKLNLDDDVFNISSKYDGKSKKRSKTTRNKKDNYFGLEYAEERR